MLKLHQDEVDKEEEKKFALDLKTGMSPTNFYNDFTQNLPVLMTNNNIKRGSEGSLSLGKSSNKPNMITKIANMGRVGRKLNE